MKAVALAPDPRGEMPHGHERYLPVAAGRTDWLVDMGTILARLAAMDAGTAAADAAAIRRAAEIAIAAADHLRAEFARTAAGLRGAGAEAGGRRAAELGGRLTELGGELTAAAAALDSAAGHLTATRAHAATVAAQSAAAPVRGVAGSDLAIRGELARRLTASYNEPMAATGGGLNAVSATTARMSAEPAVGDVAAPIGVGTVGADHGGNGTGRAAQPSSFGEAAGPVSPVGAATPAAQVPLRPDSISEPTAPAAHLSPAASPAAPVPTGATPPVGLSGTPPAGPAGPAAPGAATRADRAGHSVDSGVGMPLGEMRHRETPPGEMPTDSDSAGGMPFATAPGVPAAGSTASPIAPLRPGVPSVGLPTGVPAGTAPVGRGPAGGGFLPPPAARSTRAGEDTEHRPAGFLQSTDHADAIIGELPLVGPAVIGDEPPPEVPLNLDTMTVAELAAAARLGDDRDGTGRDGDR